MNRRELLRVAAGAATGMFTAPLVQRLSAAPLAEPATRRTQVLASYEATQFEQGLLTHALLKGMRGAALDREEYVDVSKLFQYAADEVPNS